MNDRAVPRIFSTARCTARRLRSLSDPGPRFVWDEAVEDIHERLAFVRHEPDRALIIGEHASHLTDSLRQAGSEVTTRDIVMRNGQEALNLERPYPDTGFDFIGVLGLLDAVNDLPGALIHIRNALTPGGLAIASFIGGGSLPRLRAAMLAADGDRPAARIHPMIDPRAAPQLLQRAGWKDPVVDTHTLTVRYSSLDRLVQDLREHGLTSVLADAAPPLGKAALARARAAFLDQADPDDKVAETIEIVTLTGRRSLAGT